MSGATTSNILGGQLLPSKTWGVELNRIVKIRVNGSKRPLASAHNSGGVWSATLTSDRNGDFDGCDNNDANQDNCSTALTKDRIQLGSGPFSSVSDRYFDVRGLCETEYRQAFYRAHVSIKLATGAGSLQRVCRAPDWLWLQRKGIRLQGRGCNCHYKYVVRMAQQRHYLVQQPAGGGEHRDTGDAAVDGGRRDPACGSTVSEGERPEWQVRLQPAPGTQRQIEYNVVNAGGAELASWQGAGSTTEEGYVRKLPRDNTFARFREAYPGFAGFEFRLQANPSLTVQCTWQFDNSGSGNPNTGSGTPTDTTTTTTPRNPSTPTNTGGRRWRRW